MAEAINCMCVVQEAQISGEVEAALRSELNELSHDVFSAPVNINWIVVPKNSGFTAGKPSTSAIVSMSAQTPVEQARRVEILQNICDLWMKNTGCELDEIVAVVNDPRD